MTKTSDEILKETGSDIDHSKQVEEYSIKLFDAICENICHFTRREKEYLVEASKLHDIGYFIDKKSHHKHSMNMIIEQGIDGFDEYETTLIANIARYHRSSFPDKENHTNYAALCPKDRKLVKQLSSILRIADGLDKPHKNLILRIRIEEKTETFEIYIKTIGFKPNLKMAQNKKDLFEKTFKKEVVFLFE